MKKIIKILPIFLGLFFYSQQNYFVVTIDKKDKNYPNEHPLYYWIIDLSEKESKIAPLYFGKIDNDIKDRCLKYDRISIFNEENIFTVTDDVLNKISHNKTNILNIKKKWLIGQNKKPMNYKVYVTPISGNLFSCNINQREGEKINYQGKIYLIDENFEINMNLLKTDSDKLESLKWINYHFIKTYPYSK